MEYKIVVGNSVATLEEQVNILIKQGFKPIGNVVFVDAKEPMLIQPMIKDNQINQQ